MSDIVREFERELARWRTRYAGDPERELLRLYLLALEREENVAVAYRQQILGPRLAQMCVPTDLREVMRTALVGIWHDEERHTAYVQRMLFELGQPTVRARMLVHQLAGLLGGWSVAVLQHKDWSNALISRALATLIVWAGNISGRVPRSVRRHLGRCSFRDFCRLNVETEGTALLCWERLVALAAEIPGISHARVREFRCIAEDEERHRQVFSILASILTNNDELRAGVRAASLAAQIQSVSASGEWIGRTATLPQSIERSCAA